MASGSSLISVSRKIGLLLGRGFLIGTHIVLMGLTKGFENFFLIERHHFIPARFAEEYNRETGELIRGKVELACSLGIGISVLSGVFGYLLFPDLRFRQVVIQLLVIVAAISIIILNRKARELRQLRLIGYLLSFTLTLAVGAYYLISPQASMVGVSGFLIALLTSSFIFPWTFRQTYLLCFINLVVYATVFQLIGRTSQSSYFFFDLMLLIIASLIACAIKRSDDFKRQREFILNKELSEAKESIENDLRLARRLHRSLLPKSVATEHVEIAVDHVAAHHIGGDFGRIYHPDKTSLVLFICDITGHGVSSALLVNRTFAEIESLMRHNSQPCVILSGLNAFVRDSFKGHPMFLSAFCGSLDFKTQTLVYSNYGHPPQLLLKHTSKEVHLMKAGTTILGVEPAIRKGSLFEEKISFQSGDRLILYTDGILEARDAGGEQFGLDRLVKFTLSNYQCPVGEFNHLLIRTIKDYSSRPVSDDVLLMTVQTKP
jgi:serine phosphatase RsbU (regulator of sigma subunit)